jgi:hypothetical protein
MMNYSEIRANYPQLSTVSTAHSSLRYQLGGGKADARLEGGDMGDRLRCVSLCYSCLLRPAGCWLVSALARLSLLLLLSLSQHSMSLLSHRIQHEISSAIGIVHRGPSPSCQLLAFSLFQPSVRSSPVRLTRFLRTFETLVRLLRLRVT